MYNITAYSKKKAKELGVSIRVSTRKNKKIDVYKDGKFLQAIGDLRYGDYSTYVKTRGKKFADERRRLYHIRHKSGFYSKAILW